MPKIYLSDGDDINTRTCSRCTETKTISSFTKDVKYPCGYTRTCKKCHGESRKDMTAGYRMRHREELRSKYDLEKRRKYYDKPYAYNPNRYNTYQKQYSARNAVHTAVRNGTLRKLPCTVCGTMDNLHGHHEDYDKPLDVIWFCRKHHGQRHRELNDREWLDSDLDI